MGMSKIVGRVVALLMVGTGVSAPIIVNNLNPATDEGDTPSIEESLNVEEETSIVGNDPALRVESTSQPKESSKEQPTLTPVVTFTPDPIESTTVLPPASNSAEWSDPSGVASPTEYWAKYAGLCPNQQPKDSIFWSQSRYLAFARHGEHPWPTYQHYVATYWNFHMLYGYNNDELSISSFANMGYGDDQANRAVGLWINYATMSIYADSLYRAEPWTNSTRAYWDEVAEEATDYLRHLDGAYHVECGV